jgi:cytochrome c peroxidase
MAGSRVTAPVACATCHAPARAFTDGRPVSIGIGRAGQRNAPTILNALYNKTQFWDGRVDTPGSEYHWVRSV